MITIEKKQTKKKKNYIMNTTNTKAVLFVLDLPNNLEIKNITLKIPKDRNNK